MTQHLYVGSSSLVHMNDFCSQGLFSNLYPSLTGFINKDNQNFRWKVHWGSWQKVRVLWIQVPWTKPLVVFCGTDRSYFKISTLLFDGLKPYTMKWWYPEGTAKLRWYSQLSHVLYALFSTYSSELLRASSAISAIQI